jgi:hypothetical protein
MPRHRNEALLSPIPFRVGGGEKDEEKLQDMSLELTLPSSLDKMGRRHDSMNAERKVLMAIASLKSLLEKAAMHDYAVGAFNVHNLDFIQGVMEAAAEMRSPVILAIAPVSIEYAGLETLVRLARFYAENASVPVAVHLDHGKDVDTVRRAILAGCSSVMFDGSSLPFEENVRRTREVVEAAHGAGIPVEGEIGDPDPGGSPALLHPA